MRRIPAGTVVHNRVNGRAYRLEEFLGQGGFGTAYRARRLGPSGSPTGATICLKFTTHADVWHGEAFFAGLLGSSPYVVRQVDAFPTEVVFGKSSRMVFAIEMEYIDTGTVEDACGDGRLPWPEDRVARKVRNLLRPLAALHQIGSSHRDITPGNVHVADRAVLKLGDFGITKTGLPKSGVKADVANWSYAPFDLGTYWRPADDVYQVGLLMLTLLAGAPMGNTVGKVDVNGLTSREYGLRAAIKAAISVKAQRPQTAEVLMRQLPTKQGG